ncbi:MAG TPA: DUF3558 family protein [Baekduia sp.]|uniref:DUF3558 family protein n=1 Tax=Baekduia sp. TaxID=2600305 RepID=UPI002D782106|nr:DUF3558 family protein [Baekduia sp.]HET6508232.1 DUF3558 family protein [Baekduia sp.]
MKTFAPLTTALLAAALLAGCGGGGDRHAQRGPLGSPDNPVPATPQSEHAANEKGAAVKPGYATLLQKQTSKPARRFTPCNLVTKSQARAIMRTAIAEPVEAPLGPSCVYRSRDGRTSVSLAVTTQSLSALSRQVQQASKLKVTGHRAVCGRSVLYVSIKRGQTLSVGAPCVTALKFATTAVRRLDR